MVLKAHKLQNLWNTHNAEQLLTAFTPDTTWRFKDRMLHGPKEIKEYLTEKWDHQKKYEVKIVPFTYHNDRVAVQVEYEYQDDVTGEWHRTHGNEHWIVNEDGLIKRLDFSSDDVKINASDRRFKSPNESII
eukprot:TRINITY_DN2882_c0_g1_i2.p1 TRINITY_DN2882_c0_g1~~TRINITY_DN2882_c0_g1_i2.p1  ORF type:complete len:132 (-),score=22.58 TRINITY_DN2882_c0_g1_i2:134-529(-)